MWYTTRHENTHFYPTAKRRRTAPDPGGIAFVRCLCVATLPDLARPRARGERASTIARQLGCDDQTVRNVIHGFNAAGLAVLREGSSRPHHLRTTFSAEGCQRLQDLLHRSPREFGRDRGLWTLELAAQVSFEQGITACEVSTESVRRALKRLKTNWKRAKHWITSPDPQYLLKKTRATA
jgi:transposase